MRRTAAVLWLMAMVVGVWGCSRYPKPSAPPPQRRADFGPDPALSSVHDDVSMGSPWVQRFLVKDIDASPGQGRRWTFEHPEMRFQLDAKDNRKLVVDFIAHSVNFKSTGPFTVDFLVNGKSVGKLRCAKPEEHRFEAPVARELLEASAETRVAFQVDKYWIAPGDGAKLGILLVDVGFFAR